MRRLVLAAATLCAVAGAALWSAADRSPAPPPGSSLTIAAAPGRAAAVSRELARLGAPVTVRVGSLLQVRAAPGLEARLRRVPGVRGVGPAAVGAARPGDLAGRRAHRRRRAARARPRRHRHPHRRSSTSASATPGAACSARSCRRSRRSTRSSRSTTRAASPTSRALSNDDQPTGHGANVAQVVWDIAPGARYTLVNYHTQLELSQAVDWLVNGPDGKPRVDIVVHSQLVPRRAVRRHGRGRAARSIAPTTRASSGSTRPATTRAATGRASSATPDKDGWADIGPLGRGYLAFPLTGGVGMGATLYWSDCTQGRRRRRGVERALPDRRHRHGAELAGRATPRARSDASQPAGVRGLPARRRRAPTACASCRARRASSATSRSSAAASSSATRRPWGRASRRRATRAARSRSARATGRATPRPTTRRRARPQDGRLKPDVVAPASTAVWPGIAMVGTSASAPHAAGAAALLMQRDRAAGRPSDPDTIAARADRERPRHRAAGPGRRSPARAASGSTSTRRPGSRRRRPPASRWATRRASTSRVDDAGTIEASGVSIDGVAGGRGAPGVLHLRLDTRALARGPARAPCSGRATWPATAPSWR